MAVKGKKKKGGWRVRANTVLATVTLESGECFTIKAMVEGFIIEVNQRLAQQVDYLKLHPEEKGYVAVI